MNNKFSENLKKIRKDNNLSQEQLAFELGVSRQAISKWESSVSYPEMDKIIIRDPKHSEYKFINGLFKGTVGLIKFFTLCFSLLLFIILIGLFVAFVISFLTIKTGMFFIGLTMAILSVSIIDIVVILLLLNFVFNRKNDKKKDYMDFYNIINYNWSWY